MKSIYKILFCFAVVVGLHGTAFAAPAAPDWASTWFQPSGLPWDDTLKTFLNEFSGPIPQVFAALMVTMAGLTLMFGETGGLFRTSLHAVLGIGLALNVGPWVGMIVNGYISGANNTSLPPMPNFTDQNPLSMFGSYLIALCQNGASALIPYALGMVAVFAVIDICLVIAFKFEQDHIKLLLKETLRVGFFVFLVTNWTTNMHVVTEIYQSFQQLGVIAGGSQAAAGLSSAGGSGGISSAVPPDDIVKAGSKIVIAMWDKLPSGINMLGTALFNVAVMIGVIITTYLTAIEILMNELEFWIIATLCIPLVPFGMFQHTRFIFERVIGGIFNLGIKVMVLSFLAMFVSTYFVNMANSFANANNMADISVLMSTLLGCAVLFMLVKTSPALASSLINGSPSLSGSSLPSMNPIPFLMKSAGVSGAAVAMTRSQSAMKDADGNPVIGADGRPQYQQTSLATKAGRFSANLGRLAVAKGMNTFNQAQSEALNLYENKVRMGQFRSGEQTYDPRKFTGSATDYVRGRGGSGDGGNYEGSVVKSAIDEMASTKAASTDTGSHLRSVLQEQRKTKELDKDKD